MMSLLFSTCILVGLRCIVSCKATPVFRVFSLRLIRLWIILFLHLRPSDLFNSSIHHRSKRIWHLFILSFQLSSTLWYLIYSCPSWSIKIKFNYVQARIWSIDLLLSHLVIIKTKYTALIRICRPYFEGNVRLGYHIFRSICKTRLETEWCYLPIRFGSPELIATHKNAVAKGRLTFMLCTHTIGNHLINLGNVIDVYKKNEI